MRIMRQKSFFASMEGTGGVGSTAAAGTPPALFLSEVFVQYAFHTSSRLSCARKAANQSSLRSVSPRSMSCHAPVSWGPCWMAWLM